MSDSERYVVRNPQVISETIDGEVIIVNLEDGNYYSAEGVAADIWNLVEQRVAVPTILECMVQKYEGIAEEIIDSVHSFVRQLQKEELIVPSLNSDGDPEAFAELPAAAEPNSSIAFEPPVLERYTDMQDLLLVDPIHEVDEKGWPRTKVE